jgi:hypothetical protein
MPAPAAGAQRGQRCLEWHVGTEVVQTAHADRSGLDGLRIERSSGRGCPGQCPVGRPRGKRQHRIGKLVGAALPVGAATYDTSLADDVIAGHAITCCRNVGRRLRRHVPASRDVTQG